MVFIAGNIAGTTCCVMAGCAVIGVAGVARQGGRFMGRHGVHGVFINPRGFRGNSNVISSVGCSGNIGSLIGTLL